MKEILGIKLGMTRIFGSDGEAIPVSVIEAGPCVVVAVRTPEKEGYKAVQVGFGNKRANLFNKPLAGHYKKAQQEVRRYLRELKADGEFKVGDELKVDLFKKGEKVDITGISKGLGFQGVMRRHNFGGANITHGQSDRQRAPGSVGASSYPSRVFRGQRMAGKMGKDRVTALNLEVAQVIGEQNLLLVRGAIPGKKGTLLKIRTSNRPR
ncbi:50S ribosomal subunit protein L3 [Candidatus Zixiibacteriota bacterium]|nr:50S ribosomal subunit protein L3 [candidate division Zixibacteria bacterium]